VPEDTVAVTGDRLAEPSRMALLLRDRSFDSCLLRSSRGSGRKSAAEWVPNPGPQTQAFLCEADELFYGGGKTDLGIGLALSEISGLSHRTLVVLKYSRVVWITDLLPKRAEARDPRHDGPWDERDEIDAGR
jgi:hypothetical protein